MANYIRDTASQNLVAKIANNPMPQRCEYSTLVKIDQYQNKKLVSPRKGRIDSPELNEVVPDDLPIADEINPLEFYILPLSAQKSGGIGTVSTDGDA